MIVFVDSLGSLWQRKDLPNGGTRVWNTTGVMTASRVRSCAMSFGQVLFGGKAKAFLNHRSVITGSAWISRELTAVANGRRLTLLCRAPKAAVPDWYLVTVTDGLIGAIEPDGVDPTNALVVSWSRHRDRQEWLLLVRPYAWLSGAAGSAVWTPTDDSYLWSIRRW